MNSHSNERLFNPFPGLRAFRMDEDYVFFGREQQTAELLKLLRRHRFIAVVGTSGSGKSSLVRAGLLPELHGGTMNEAGSRWEMAILRPGGEPIANLARALCDMRCSRADDPDAIPQLMATLRHSGMGLIEAVRQAKIEAGTNTLVVVDQFEEIFRYHQAGACHEETAEAFVNLLLEASSQTECPVYVVLTMRSDYLGDCSQFRGLAEAVNRGEYLIPRLSRDQLRSAIEGPVRVGGGRISYRLVQQLLNDISRDQDQLPVLQHALMRTWSHWIAHRQGEEPMDLVHYQAVGEMGAALSRHADEIYSELDDDRLRLIAERLFKALTERGADNRGIRHPNRFDSLCDIVAAEEHETGRVVDAFRKQGRTFLMPADQLVVKSDTVIDISHESLMRVWQRLDRWVEEESQSARIYRRLAESALLHLEGKADLYHDPDLQIALTWREKEQPNAYWAARYHPGFVDAMAFLDASQKAKHAEDQARELARQRELEQAKALAQAERLRAEEQAHFAARLKWLVRGLGLLALIAIAALIAALMARKESQRNAELAAANERVAKQNAEEAGRQAALASDKAQESLNSLVQLNFSTGLRLTEAGDPLAALPWLAEALRLVQGEPGKESTHRSRLNFLLAGVPRLLHIFTNALPVLSIEFSPDGNHLLTASPNGIVRIWDTEAGQLKRTLICAAADDRVDGLPLVQLATFSPDGTRILAAAGNRAFLWEFATGHELFPPLAHSNYLGKAGFSPDGRYIVTASSDQTARIWNAATGQPMSPPLRHRGYVYEATFNPDGNRVITAAQDGARLWNGQSGEQIGPTLHHRAGVNSVDFSPDGRRVITGSEDGTAQIWDGSTGEATAIVLKHPDAVWEARFSPDGTKIMTRCRDQVYRLWRADTGDPLPDLRDEKHGFSRHAAFSPDGRFLAASFSQGYALIWNTTTGEQVAPPLKQSGNILWLTFSPEARRIATASQDGTIRLWDIAGQSSGATAVKHNATVSALDFSSDGQRIVTGSMDGVVRIWNALSFEPISPPLVHPAAVVDAAFSPDGQTVASVCSGGPVWVWDALTGAKRLGPLDQAAGRMKSSAATATPGLVAPLGLTSRPMEYPIGLHAIAFSRDGSLLAARSSLGTLTVWDAHSGHVHWNNINGIGSFAFSPDGHSIVTTEGEQEAQIRSARTGAASRPPLRHGPSLAAAMFSPDGERIVTWGQGEARIWNARNGQGIGQPLRHHTFIRTVTFSEDGRRLATASTDLTARIWEATTGEALTPLLRHTVPVEQALFSPDGRALVTATLDGAMALWDPDTGQPISATLEHGARLTHLRFSLDSRRLLSAGLNQIVRVWNLPSEDRPAPELQVRAHLLAAARVDETGGLERLSPEQQWQQFDQLKEQHPDKFSLPQPDLLEWHRREAAASAETKHWFAAHFHVRRALALTPEDTNLQHRLQMAAAELAETNGLSTHELVMARFPPRDVRAKPEQIDLTEFYNATLGETWHLGATDNHLGGVPQGLVTLAGVQFDVRGVIQLAGGALGRRFPESVEDIPIRLKCRRIHFLHASGYAGGLPSGLKIGLYRLHYADGQTREISIRKDHQVRDWWNQPHMSPPLPLSSNDSVLAWSGTNPAMQNRSSLNLFRTTWENSLPDVEIKSIEYMSSMTQAAPFLIAITLE